MKPCIGPDDYIPMHYKAGERFQSGKDWFWVLQAFPFGCVCCLAQGFAQRKDRLYTLDYRTNTLNPADDSMRCKDCGELLCQCNTPEQQPIETEPMPEIKPTSLEDIKTCDEERSFACVHVKVISYGEVKKGTASNGRKWKIQPADFRCVESGAKMKGAFMDDHADDPPPKNTELMITGTKGSKGYQGISLKIRETEKAVYKDININGQASIKVVGEAPAKQESYAEDDDEPVKKPSQSTERSRPAASKAADAKVSPFVHQRVELWFRCFDAVTKEAAVRDIDLEGDAASITTTIFLTFKGDYGVYNDPQFSGAEEPEAVATEVVEDDKPAATKEYKLKDAKKPAPKEPEEEEEEKPKPAKISSWKDVVWPKSNEKLIDIVTKAPLRFCKIVAWALTASPKDAETKRIQANVLIGAGESDMGDVKSLVKQWLILSMTEVEGLTQDAIDAYSKAQFGKTMDKVKEETVANLLKGDNLKEFAEAAAKAATPDEEPAAETDEDEMPE